MAAIKAVGYVRMSTDDQQGSPAQQREAIVEYASRNDYSIDRWYEDLAVSGDATEKRKDFQRMVSDGSDGKFNAILCWDQDRFGRFDLIEAGKWIHPLRLANVHLATVTGGKTDWNNLVDQLGYMAKQMGKHQYLQDLAKNVKRGHDRSVREGKWTTGFAPFGYAVDSVTRKLVLGPAKEVRLVKQLFERYATGESYRQLAAWMNAQGIKTRRGNDWQQRSIAHVLKNERYRGHLFYGIMDKSKYLDHSPSNGKPVKRPRDEWIIVRNSHEPLISQELWDRVQDRKEGNKRLCGPNTKNQYPLTGVLYCGNCGNRMGGVTYGANKSYICLTYQSGRDGCERRTIRQDAILHQVLYQLRTQLFDRFFDETVREQIKEAMRAKLLAGDEEAKHKRRDDAVRLAEVEGELEQAVTAMISTSDDLRPLVEKRVRELRTERDELADRIAMDVAPADVQIQRVEDRINKAIGWLDHLEDLVQTDVDPTEVARCLRQYVSRVEVDTIRIPEGAQGKRHKIKLTGGRIYFQTESFPNWPMDEYVTLVPPSGRWSTARRAKW